jgi:hypothetical protein
MTSSPAEFTMSVVQDITVVPVDYVPPVIEVKRRCSVRFPNAYSTIAGKEKGFQVALYNELVTTHNLNNDVVIDNFETTSGRTQQIIS